MKLQYFFVIELCKWEHYWGFQNIFVNFKLIPKIFHLNQIMSQRRESEKDSGSRRYHKKFGDTTSTKCRAAKLARGKRETTRAIIAYEWIFMGVRIGTLRGK